MKKLMVAAAAVLVGIVANAASFTWNSGTMTLPSGADSDGNITGYLFVLNATQYAAISSVDDVWNTYGSQLASATKSQIDDMGDIALKDNTKNYGAGDTAYAAIIYAVTEGGKDYYVSNYGSYTFTASANKSQSNMGLKLNGTGAALAGWQQSSAVPEPTSGLLLLLGVAGLALKRKRA